MKALYVASIMWWSIGLDFSLVIRDPEFKSCSSNRLQSQHKDLSSVVESVISVVNPVYK